MHVVRPVTITDAMLVSCNVPENDAPVYNSATTYAVGNVVMVVTAGDHHRYESLQAANTNHDPKTSPLWWLDMGATNRWKLFDNKVSSQTTYAGTIELELLPGGINSIALMNLEAARVEITLRDESNVVVYSKVENLQLRNVDNMYSYYFEPFAYLENVIFTDVPTYYQGKLSVSIVPINGRSAKCGVLVVGLSRYIGDVLYNLTAGVKDWSTKKTDDFGDTVLVKRQTSRRVTYSLLVKNDIRDEVFRILSKLNGEPLAWFGAQGFDVSVVFGFYEDMSIVLQNAAYSTCNLQIQGLT
jgi:hypothetical protein